MIVRGFDEIERTRCLAGASCAFGVFDGVHKGHRYIIDCALSAAGEGPTAIITFDRDPDELFRANGLLKLMSNEQRLSALDAIGADYVVVLPFDEELAALEPDAFTDRLFAAAVPTQIHVGEDFRYGARAEGNVQKLAAWGSAHGMDALAHELLVVDGAPVTATRIRTALQECRIDEANALLGRPFAYQGDVLRGRGEGASMGFATANLSIDPLCYVLGEGVYGGYAYVGGKRYKAAVSVGGAPSFADRAKANLEVHILDFEDDLYDAQLRVEFVAFLRPLIVFDSIDELIATVMGNISWCRENL